MKNLFFLLSLLVLSSTNGQNCSDLIITEIVFGYQGSIPNQGEDTQYNHSVEVFNPTDDPIDLSNYRIELLPETGTSIVIDLEGIVPSDGIFVISNITAIADITSVSDALDLLLSFEGMVAIQLSKTTGEIVDKIGTQGVEQSSEIIDLDALLNDPNYLNTFDVNLGSIENLLIRRKSTVKSGNLDFTNVIFLDEWLIYPNFEISNLGQHLSACTAAMLGWTNVQPTWWEFEFAEELGAIDDESPGTASEFAVGEVCLTEPLTYDQNVTIFGTNHEYTGDNGEDGIATEWVDWSSEVIISANEFVIPAGELCMSWFDLAFAIVDGEPEGDEGFGIVVLANDPATSLSITDPDRNVIDFRIRELMTSTEDIETLSSNILAYPTIATNQITVKSEAEGIVIEEVKLYNINGRFLKLFKFDGGYNHTVELNIGQINSSGYHMLFIKTNKGTMVKRFYKR